MAQKQGEKCNRREHKSSKTSRRKGKRITFDDNETEEAQEVKRQERPVTERNNNNTQTATTRNSHISPSPPPSSSSSSSFVNKSDSERKIKQKESRSTIRNPAEYAILTLYREGCDIEQTINDMERTFRPPTQEMSDGYSLEITNAVRSNDLAALKELHSQGINLDCCNQFGNTLLHLACRRGLTKIVKFLVYEAKVCIQVRDEQERTPMHDACWTSEPNFEIIEVFLCETPEHLLMVDSLGCTPLDYVPKDYWNEWVEFLLSKKPVFTAKWA